MQTADLTPTFGKTNGAQLIDVYVSQPGATPTSNAASYPSMNYTTATPWSRLIEVQGFGGDHFENATGASVGTVNVGANQVSRYITFSVDKTALGGTPATGWAFTVTLTGQDGTHGTDQTRGFASTPQAYAFGVCAVGGSAAICAQDSNTVPKVMDALTPSGVDQATELGATPVVLQPVSLN